MATLAAQVINQAGVTPTYAAASAGGDSFPAGAGFFLHVKNGSASPITVMLVTPGTVSGLAVADQPVIVANASEKMISTPDSLYTDPATGLASATYTSATTVTVASIRI